MCALLYNTHAYGGTGHVRLLELVLPKPCAIIMFGIHLVPYNVI